MRTQGHEESLGSYVQSLGVVQHQILGTVISSLICKGKVSFYQVIY